MAGEALSAYGALQQGSSDKAAGEFNAQIAERNAEYTIKKSAEDERRQRVISKKFIGDIRSSYGASGITMDGSALDVLEASAADAELDALTIRHEGRVKAAGYINEANYERTAGENAKRQSYLKAAGYVIQGSEKVAKAVAGGGG